MARTGRLLWVVATLASCPVALAQGLSGPLAGPNVTSPTVKATSHLQTSHGPTRRAKPATAAKRAALPSSSNWPSRAPVLPVARSAAARPSATPDPISFGLKWNGSNDTAAQTRIDNLNGNAAGTGAEVGMKLHF